MLREGPITVAFVGFYCAANSSANVHGHSLLEELAPFKQQLGALLGSSPVDELRLAVPETLVLTHIPGLLQDENVDEALAAGLDSLKQILNTVEERKHRIEVGDLDQYPSLASTP